MLNQNNRRACLNAIQTHYGMVADLLAERRNLSCYWSIWACDRVRLLEVIREKERITINEYLKKV